MHEYINNNGSEIRTICIHKVCNKLAVYRLYIHQRCKYRHHHHILNYYQLNYYSLYYYQDSSCRVYNIHLIRTVMNQNNLHLEII